MGKKLAGLACVALLFVTAGCGSSRPSDGDVAKALKKQSSSSTSTTKPTSKQIDCSAKALVASKLSDAALKAIVTQDKKFKPTKADVAALTKIEPALVKCQK